MISNDIKEENASRGGERKTDGEVGTPDHPPGKRGCRRIRKLLPNRFHIFFSPFPHPQRISEFENEKEK